MISLKKIYEEIKPKYTIFCDMDGVLVDFDKGYEDLTGIYTKHSDVQDKNTFWNTFNNSLKEKGMSEYEYWANLDWEKGGPMLWNYIKKYTPYILTSPSSNPKSREGKRNWVSRLDGMKNIYFRKAQDKADFSRKNKILIDDRADTIERWNSKDGIGILHDPKNPRATLKTLKQLGL
jgi:5'(3')-deoxyribonucleotidase